MPPKQGPVTDGGCWTERKTSFRLSSAWKCRWSAIWN